MATEDGGVIATTDDGSAVTFDSNGNATGQLGVLPTYAWQGSAYQVGSINRVTAIPLYMATGFWSVGGGNPSGNGTPSLADQCPPLPSCKTPVFGPQRECPDAMERLHNARKDLLRQLIDSNSECYKSVNARIFSKITVDPWHQNITIRDLVKYLSDDSGIMFWDGSRSKAKLRHAECGENNGNSGCQSDERILMDMAFADRKDAKTAVTVTPSRPFKSFWQPNRTKATSQYEGFGDGIDRRNDGKNIFNESVLLHEALHGLTGLPDWFLYPTLVINSTLTGGVQYGASFGISVYIKLKVLNACPVNAYVLPQE